MNKLYAIVLAVVLLAGCTSTKTYTNTTVTPAANTSVSPQPTVVKFGATLPLTGSLANVGQGMRDAMLLAVDDVNAAGGINGSKLQLVIEDTACDPGQAVPAVNKLISVDNVIAIAGGTCSGESLAMTPITTPAKIIMMSPSSTNPQLTTKGGAYWFRLSPSDAFQGLIGAKYVKNELNISKVAILYLNNDWGVGLKDTFESAFVQMGGQVTDVESMDPDTTDVRTQLTKIKAAGEALIYMPCFPKECAVALTQMSQLGITAKLLGGDGADDPTTLSQVGAAANGFTLTVPSGAGPDFASKFKAKYGKDPGAYGAQSYDAIRLLAQAAAAGSSGDSMAAYLHSVKYSGFTGPESFDSNGDLVSGKYDLKQWNNGSYVLLKQISSQ